MINQRFHHLDLSVPCLFLQLRKETSRKEVFSYDLFLGKAQILLQEEWPAAVMFTEAFSALCKAADRCLFQPFNVVSVVQFKEENSPRTISEKHFKVVTGMKYKDRSLLYKIDLFLLHPPPNSKNQKPTTHNHTPHILYYLADLV